jgi:DNA-directed RNA polymerase subunit RPC12/RpoP
MVCPKCRTQMNPGPSRGNARDYLCPVCGYRTLGPKESTPQLPKLGRVPTAPVESEKEKPSDKAAQVSTPKRKTKVVSKRPEKPAPPAPDPFLAELQAEMKILSLEISDFETLFAREIQKLKTRLTSLGTKIPTRDE